MKKIILLVLFSVLVASAFDLSEFSNKQDHYWLGFGSGVGGYGVARLITWNKYLDEPMDKAEVKRRNISFFSGVGTVILVGAGKELIWDLALGKGQSGWEDFEYTFIGGLGSSIAAYIIDCTFIKRKDKQAAYLEYFYLLPRKNSIKLYCQFRF